MQHSEIFNSVQLRTELQKAKIPGDIII